MVDFSNEMKAKWTQNQIHCFYEICLQFHTDFFRFINFEIVPL